MRFISISQILIFLLIVFTQVSGKEYVAFMMSSNNDGESWQQPVFIPNSHRFESCKLAEVNGVWYIYGPSSGADSVLYMRSFDQGQTWSQPTLYSYGLNAERLEVWLDETGMYVLIIEKNSNMVSLLMPQDFLVPGFFINDFSSAVNTHDGDIIRTKSGTIYVSFLYDLYNNRYMLSRDNGDSWEIINIHKSGYYGPKFSLCDSNLVVISHHYGTAPPYDAEIRFTMDDGFSWNNEWIQISYTPNTTIDRWTQIVPTASGQFLGIWFNSNEYQIQSRKTNDLSLWPSTSQSLERLNQVTRNHDLNVSRMNGKTCVIFYDSMEVAPSPPTEVSVMVGNNKNEIQWALNVEEDIDYYRIYKNTTEDFSGASLVDTVHHPGQSLSHFSVGTEMTYYWVTAMDKSGYESFPSLVLKADRQSQINHALYFDGNDDYVISSLDMSYGDTYTVEFWFKYFSGNSNYWLIHRGYSPNCDYEPAIRVINSSNMLEANVSGCSSSGEVGTIEINPDQWYHMALAVNQNSQKLYLNGQNIASSSAYSRSIIDKFSLGVYRYMVSTFLNGAIDELRIWDTVRSENQILQTMQDTLSLTYYDSPDSGLVAYWRMDGNALDLSTTQNHGRVFGGAEFIPSDALEPASKKLIAYYPFNGNANDESGNMNQGTVVGAQLTSDRFGNPESAYSFDGINDYIIIPNSGLLNLITEWTYCVWYYPPADANQVNYIMGRGEDSGDRHQNIIQYIGTTNQFYHAYEFENSGGIGDYSASTFSQRNEWYFIVSTRSSDGNYKLYVNGKEEGSLNNANPAASINSETYIGVINNIPGGLEHFARGYIDDVSIYNYALTDSEIQALYQPGEYPEIFQKITVGNIVNDIATSRGCAWADYNNDGFEDLFVANTAGENNFLYANNGNGTFTRILSGEIVTDGGYSYIGSWGDFNNDKNIDLIVSNTQENNFLYQNNGDGTFTKITSNLIVSTPSWATGGSWADYDNDGLLDLFLTNVNYAYSADNILFHNRGNGDFEKIMNGDVVNDGKNSSAPAWVDYNNDGYQDLFVPNRINEDNLLYLNNQNGTFTKITTNPLVSGGRNSLGASWGDYDNDGDFDLYVTNLNAPNFFYENYDDGSFIRIDTLSIVSFSDSSYGSIWTDFNNDGFLDLFVTARIGENKLFLNNGNKSFRKATGEALSNERTTTLSCAAADYDNDGFADIFITTDEFVPNILYKNTGNENNWLHLKLCGAQTNSAAIGARVSIKAKINDRDFWQMREISGLTGGGEGSQNSLRAMFGLGDATIVDSIKIKWPGGSTWDTTTVSVNQILSINENIAIDRIAPGVPLDLNASGSNPSSWQNSTSFSINWTNPFDESGIDKAFYKFNEPPLNNSDYDYDVPANPPIQVNATMEGGQMLYIWLADSNGNVNYKEHAIVNLRVDQTSPSGSVVEVPDTVGNETFLVTWSTGSDQGGSGLSGNYDVRVKEGAGSWTIWKNNFHGNSDLFNGQNGRTYYFESAARDSAGNVENISGLSEATTLVDTSSGIDLLPPAGPLSLQTIPEDWKNSNSFSITWQNPSGDPVISGAYLKIGDQPDKDEDGVFYPGNINSITDIILPGEGEYSLYVWLKDLNENHSFLTAKSTQARFDSSKPTIQHTPVEQSNIFRNVTIDASASDTYSGIRKLSLYYRIPGQPETTDSTLFVNNQALIPATTNTENGIEYTIVAEDYAGNLTSSPDNDFHLIQAILNESESKMTLPLHSGETVNDYRIISVPFITDNAKPSAVFEDDLGIYDKYSWKLFDVIGGVLRSFDIIRDLEVVKPGKGFLFITKNTGVYIDAGIAYSTIPEQYQNIPMDAGWNLIGNPFFMDIPIDSLTVNGQIPEIWYLSDQGWKNTPGYLKKWEGVAIYVSTASTLHIGLGNGDPFNFNLRDVFSDQHWAINITARGKHGIDQDNYFGYYDDNDIIQVNRLHEPPKFEESISFYFKEQGKSLNKENLVNQQKYSAYIESKWIEGHVWDACIEGSQPYEKINLDFIMLGSPPDSTKIILIDITNNITCDLREKAKSLELILDKNALKELVIIAGSTEYVDQNMARYVKAPKNFNLQQNYPNPFNPSTNIVFEIPQKAEVSFDIYNILGQKIRTLIKNKEYKPGIHKIVWDGYNDNGITCASGVYLFIMRADSKLFSRKGILTR